MPYLAEHGNKWSSTIVLDYGLSYIQVEEADTIVQLTEELDSIDTGLLEEASKIIKALNKALDNFEMTRLLSGPYDKEGAVITISAGAGGTDAQVCVHFSFRL